MKNRIQLMLNRRLLVQIILFIAVIIALSACDSPPPTAKAVVLDQPTPAVESQQPQSAEVKKTPEFIAPLTGLKLDAAADRRPIMVMINNHPKARPQSGLSKADILYEMLAEGEITRIVALFQSRQFDGDVGPIRSIRPYFIDIGKSYGALPVHAGGSPDAYNLIADEKLQHLDEITNAGGYFWRVSFRKAPHNLYSNLIKLDQAAAKKGYPMKLANSAAIYPFKAPDDAAAGEDAAHIAITFLLANYVVSYDYDAASGEYKRYVDGKPHIDMDNNEQLSAENVVVLGAEHQILDKEGRREIKLTGSGPAYLFQKGKAQKVEWKRERVDDVIRLYQNGQEVAFYPGKTYFHIVQNKPDFLKWVTFSG